MITAELFSDTAAEVQAAELHQLVLAEKEWLEAARADTFQGYGTERAAFDSLRRVIRSRTLNGYVLRRDRDAIGIGTVVSGLVIRDPSSNYFSRSLLYGDQIDYWTEEMSQEDHTAVALTLAEATRTPTVLGVLSEAEMERAEGIVAMMEPIGKPGRIKIQISGKTYGSPRDMAPLQVYMYERSKTDA